MEQCPLQWQLANSRYGDLQRFPARPNPATAEGDIVHRVLDRLFRELAMNGLPEFGTESFRKCVTKVDIRGSVNMLMREHEELLANHPRGASSRLRAGNQQLVNNIIRLFRTQYHPGTGTAAVEATRSSSDPAEVPSGQALFDFLEERGALSELPLSHPHLPFFGIIDLVRLDHDGVSIIDFKTGAVREEHLKQIGFYAVLWWRCSGTLVHRCQIRYPSNVREFEISEDELIAVESDLKSRIERAKATLSTPRSEPRPGERCDFCDVRQFCDSFWNERVARLSKRKTTKPETRTVDVELTVASDPSDHGFEAETLDGAKLSVVFKRADEQLHGPFKIGERLRILRGVLGTQNGEIELKSWTEVFHRSDF